MNVNEEGRMKEDVKVNVKEREKERMSDALA